MKIQIGIWLDKKQAFLIAFLNGEESVKTIISNVESYHVVGGARSKTPYGPMDVVSEKKSLERQKHQLSQYFQQILTTVMDADELYLFGPADTKLKLLDVINKNKSLKFVVRKTETADSMTEGQMIAQARQAFGLELA